MMATQRKLYFMLNSSNSQINASQSYICALKLRLPCSVLPRCSDALPVVVLIIIRSASQAAVCTSIQSAIIKLYGKQSVF